MLFGRTPLRNLATFLPLLLDSWRVEMTCSLLVLAVMCPLKIWTPSQDVPKTQHAMYSLKAAMKWDEDVFGLKYDLDLLNIAAVPDFNMPVELIGTLENITKAEKHIKDIIAEADAGGSPAFVAMVFNTVQAAGAGEQDSLFF